MKKFIKTIIFFVTIFSFSAFVNAACNNEELNEWATKVEPRFIEITEVGLDSSEYAYLLTITPMRDDVLIKVTDVNGASAEAKLLKPSQKEDSIMAVGCYTNLEEETYTIEVFGAKGGVCSGQLLKTMKYTVPRFNRYIKDKRCKDSDLEICKTFTNSTKDMTQDVFEKTLKEDTPTNDSFLTKVLNAILTYGLYVIIPVVIISVIYIIRIKKYKKEERER